jgi:hypothetical protein
MVEHSPQITKILGLNHASNIKRKKMLKGREQIWSKKGKIHFFQDIRGQLFKSFYSSNC